MQFRTKIIGVAILLACGATLCAALTLLLARGIERGMMSVTKAEDQLALYLALETTVSDSLRLYITAATVPSGLVLDRLAATKAAVQDDTDAIRAIVGRDGVTANGEIAQKLNRLDEIEAVLFDINDVLEETLPELVGPRPVGQIVEPLTEIFDALDTRLAPLVDLSIALEAVKVVNARAEIAALSQRSVRLGTAAAVLTLVAAVAGVSILLAAFMRPFRAVVEGATRLAQGDLSYRIPEGGRDEFGRLSRDFNVMAAQLEQSDAALRAEEEDLQRRVAARTAELEEANARLSEQDATRRRFLADVSHELRTPLTVMRGEAEVALRMRDTARSADAEDALAAVVEQSEHMSRLVDDLLFVARRDAGEVPLKLSRTGLTPLLERVVADAGQLRPDARIALSISPVVHDIEVEVDQGRLHQLLMVLLDNALRYSPDSRDIRVEARSHGTDVQVAVCDQGIGISAEDLPYVFDRFVRGSNALPGGTGLGLPVAQAIANAHGGALEITSREGQETIVTLTLPAIQSKETGIGP